MIKLDLEINEWANELLMYPTEWEYELTYQLRNFVKDKYPEIYKAVDRLAGSNHSVEPYLTYDFYDLELVDAQIGKAYRATVIFMLPIELDDEALLADFGD